MLTINVLVEYTRLIINYHGGRLAEAPSLFQVTYQHSQPVNLGIVTRYRAVLTKAKLECRDQITFLGTTALSRMTYFFLPAPNKFTQRSRRLIPRRRCGGNRNAKH